VRFTLLMGRVPNCPLGRMLGRHQTLGWILWGINLFSGVPRNFFRGVGVVQQIQFRTEGRENGDLEALAP
jgi:hypothetical protein